MSPLLWAVWLTGGWSWCGIGFSWALWHHIDQCPGQNAAKTYLPALPCVPPAQGSVPSRGWRFPHCLLTWIWTLLWPFLGASFRDPSDHIGAPAPSSLWGLFSLSCWPWSAPGVLDSQSAEEILTHLPGYLEDEGREDWRLRVGFWVRQISLAWLYVISREQDGLCVPSHSGRWANIGSNDVSRVERGTVTVQGTA